MDGVGLGLRAAMGAAVLLPYALCCVWPLGRRLGERPLRYRVLAAGFFTAALCPWLLIDGAGPRLLALGAAFLLGPPLMGLCAGARPRYVLRAAFLGMSASAALALSFFPGTGEGLGRLPVAWITPPASALLSYLCVKSLQRLVIPFEHQILTNKNRTLEASALVYLGLMLAFYLDGFSRGGVALTYSVYALCLLGTWLSYVHSARLLRAAQNGAVSLQRNGVLEHCLQLQQAQYAALSARAAQARAARHDLRHHQRVMEQLIQDGDRERLAAYLSDFRKRVDACREEPGVCAHPMADALARHYIGQLQQAGVELDLALNIREDLGVPAFDLCIVLGNCMENALEALRETEPARRFLRMRAEQNGQILTIVASNSYRGERLRGADGGFLSTKRHGGPGIGLSSVRTVVEKYGGSVKAEAAEGVFRISLILFGGEG